MNCIPVIDTAATGANITRLRKNVNLTVRDLQNIFGFATPQAIYKWQRGEAMPTLDNMVMLTLVPSTNRSGHRPFKAAMQGSNPAGITIYSGLA